MGQNTQGRGEYEPENITLPDGTVINTGTGQPADTTSTTTLPTAGSLDTPRDPKDYVAPEYEKFQPTEVEVAKVDTTDTELGPAEEIAKQAEVAAQTVTDPGAIDQTKGTTTLADQGTKPEATTFTAKKAEELSDIEAAQGTVSPEAQATAAQATLTEKAQAVSRDTAAEEAAKATAATRPEARDYATGITTDERFKVIEAEDPEVATRIAQTISERQRQDLMDIVSKEGTNLDDIPEFKLAERRTAQVGEASSRIAQQLGTAPVVDLEGREAILGVAPKGDASQIGGIPTAAAATMQAVTGSARTAAAEDMTAVVANMPKEVTAAIAEDPATVQAQIDTGADPQVTAAVAALPQEALVSVQMEQLLAGMEEGTTPAWARPATRTAES